MLPDTILTTQLHPVGTHQSVYLCVECRDHKQNTLTSNFAFEQACLLLFERQLMRENAAADAFLQIAQDRNAAEECFP